MNNSQSNYAKQERPSKKNTYNMPIYVKFLNTK